MKGKIVKMLSQFMIVLLVVSSCQKSDIEKANEDYNWDKVIPMILGKSGESSVMRTYTYDYSVSPRGGSTFTWAVIGDATLTPDAEDTYQAEVYFPTFNDNEKVLITVFETSHAGVVSEADTFKVTVTDFKCKSISGAEEITIYEGEPNESTYSVSHRTGSTYAWSTTGGTLGTTGNDWETKLQVTAAEVGETITLTCNETHLGSLNEVPATFDVTILEFCALVNGLSDMVGSWSGTDAEYPDVVTNDIVQTTLVDATTLALTGLNAGWIVDYWGEPIVDGGTIEITVDTAVGTINIPRQYIFTTIWDGDNYDYEVKGTGKWSNCGASPTMVLTYTIHYAGESGGYGPFTADLTLGDAVK